MEAPAFYHSYIQYKGKRIGIIKLNPQLIQYLSKEPVGDSMHPRMLPMLVHPRPWLTYNSGGYLTSPSMNYYYFSLYFYSFKLLVLILKFISNVSICYEIKRLPRTISLSAKSI